jgi:peptidoglycan/xylan/chitin deacetylase (PgdA/CDA1 family)
LRENQVHASFFLTGNFYANPSYRRLIKKLKGGGHYLGAHSDKHLLYCDWGKRDSLLITQQEFEADLDANYSKMRKFGIGAADAPLFLPPYEWYNDSISLWTRAKHLQLINFSPGTISHADYTTPDMKNYRDSESIYRSILSWEQKDPNGLNGFILLLHIGTDPKRKDKFYLRLGELLKQLHARGYRFKRVDDLLE